MKKWRANKSFIALLIGMIMLFGGVLMGRSIASDFGKIKIRDISITNDDLVNIKGRIFIPSNASADNPLPAVIFCPGGSTPGTYYTAAETEIARHGFVVISWDYESVGMTEAGTDKNQGAVAVAQYVRSLGFVDPSRLGLIGHSAGELLASHILDTLKDDPSIQLSYFALENKIPKVTVNGDSVPFTQGNVGLSWGKYDENAIQRDWNTRDNDNLQLPDDFYTVFGLDKGTKVETNKWYGDYTNGTGRILLTPAISHCFGSAYPDSLKLANRFFTATYYGKETQDNSLLCYWTLLFLAFAWIGVFVIVLAFIEMLLSVPAFSGFVKASPSPKAKMNWQFFFFLLVPGILLTFLAPPVMFWANYHFLSAIPKAFPLISLNAILTFFLLAMGITCAIALLRAKFDSSMEGPMELLHGFKASINWKEFGTAILLGFIAFVVAYIANSVACKTGFFPMFFQNYWYTMTFRRWLIFPVYFILNAICLIVTSYFQTGLMVKGHERSFSVFLYVANTIPAWLYNFWVMYKTIVLQVIGVNGPAQSRPYAGMFALVYTWVFGAICFDRLYKKPAVLFSLQL